MIFEGKSYGIMPYKDWYFIFKRIRLHFMWNVITPLKHSCYVSKTMRLQRKSYAVALKKMTENNQKAK